MIRLFILLLITTFLCKLPVLRTEALRSAETDYLKSSTLIVSPLLGQPSQDLKKSSAPEFLVLKTGTLAYASSVFTSELSSPRYSPFHKLSLLAHCLKPRAPPQVSFLS